MKTTVRLFLSVVVILFSSIVFSQSFEGTIEFKKQSSSDTTHYIYYIKADKVRIDEIGSKSGTIEGSLIIDLKASEMIAISHERKIYFDKKPTSTPLPANGNAEVAKTKNTKTIQGYKCTEYVVKNPAENIQVSYWMAEGKFDFFDKLVKFLNRKDKHSVYYHKLTGVGGMFPFLSIESSPAGGSEKSRMEVTRIEKKTIDASKFELPKDYKKQTD